MRQIRNGVFETNSSSTHSLTMCMKSEYDKWVDGELYWDDWNNVLVTKDVVEQELNKLREEFREDYPDYIQGDENWEEKFFEYVDDDKQYYTYEEYEDYIEYETFFETLTTPAGEEVVSFGYYGNCY